MTRTDGYRFSIHLYVDVPVEGGETCTYILLYVCIYIMYNIWTRARERGHGQKSPPRRTIRILLPLCLQFMVSSRACVPLTTAHARTYYYYLLGCILCTYDP